MKVKYSKTAQRIVNNLLISLYTLSPQQYKSCWDPVTGEYSSKYKNSLEEAREYVSALRMDIETQILDVTAIRRVRNDIGAGKDNFAVYVHRGNGWHVFFKKHKAHYTVVNLISSSRLQIDVKQLYY